MRQSGAPQSGCMGASSVAHPSTSHGQLRTLYVDQGGDDLSVCSMRQSGAPQSGCMGASSVAHPSTSHGQLRTLYVDQGGDDLSGECHRNSTGSNSSRGSSSGFESMKSGSSRGGSSGAAASASSSSSSFLAASTSSSAQVVASGSGLMRGDSPQSRVSVHSSSSGGTSSIASTSVDALDDPTCAHFYQSQLLTDSNAVCVPEMVLKGIPEAEILALWLEKLGHSEYLSVFLTQGYDLATIARITPEDLIALGITQPAHRKRIIAEIHTWHITDSWPLAVPSGNLREWLSLIGLPEYVELFESQGYYSMNEVQKLTWEDFEDVGIKKLGHLKRLGLAIKKMKDFRLGRVSSAAGGARMISVAPHNVRQSAQVKCMQPVLYDHHAPPPPAPTPSFHSNSRSSSGHYATWARYPRSFHAANDVDTPIHKPTVQVYPHHRSPVPSEEVDEYSCAQAMGKGKSGAVHGTDAESKFVRLNLYSSARILSEEAYPGSLSSRHPAMSASSLLGNVVDTTGTSDSEDYPPPPGEEAEILALWLEKLGHSEYLSVFLTQGYDLATIARITPEDLIALGITQPAHRKRIIAEIHTWHITDSWPLAVPSGNLREWLSLIGLPEYVELFESQGYYSMNEVQKLTWEDFEDVGIKKLGHLKRLGLAIKKMKDFRLGRVSSAAGGARMISVAPHNVRQSAQVKCMQPVLYDHHAPPPPAPTPSFHSNSRSSSGHYATWARYPRSFHAANDVDTPIHKPTVQVYPHHRSPVPSEEVDEYSCAQAMGKGKSGAVHGTDAESKFVRLNLYSSARILSEEAYPGSLSSRHPAMSASSLLGNVVDTTGTSDSEDYPPPPAPLACEGSIRLLRSAFRDSPASVGGGGVELQLRSTSGSGGADSTASSTEQLPFANENCGTIRSREPTATTTAQPNNSSSLSQPCTPRRSIHNVFSDDTDITKFYAVAGNGDVLNDIGYMLQNLTDELDAMLLPSQAVRTAAPAQQLAISQAIRGAESSS
ncbi:Caskin-1 [Toxocara canis]|uniref:Caskin-1 n=1 Tax=Toxocara canis TaxID=6265 RepID=A0A0B2UIR5_TOXCA|nr:Caskin-1 [Toxocara canis]